MSSDWWGMPAGVLDQTPQINQPNLSPSIGDYLSMFQQQNNQWRQSFKPQFNQPYMPVARDNTIVDPILNNQPVYRYNPWRQDDSGGDSGVPGEGPQGPAVGSINGSLSNASTLGNIGLGLGIFGAPLGLAAAMGAIGANADVANANAMAANSFGAQPNELSVLSAIAHAISPFGMFGQDAAGQLSALGAEMSSTPDGTMSGDEDSGVGTPSPGSPGAEAGAMTAANDAIGANSNGGGGGSSSGGGSGGSAGMGDSDGSPSGTW